MRVLRQQPEKARIEIIPMIDIDLFPAGLFHGVHPVDDHQPCLPVNLPKAASSQKDLRETFNVTVMQDGALFLNKEATTLEALGQQVKSGLHKTELMVIISADDQAVHGAMVTVMDEVRLAGVSRLAIAVKSERRPQP